MPQINKESGPIYYRVSGRQGPTLLLLHEYFGTGESWVAQRLYFARHCRVIVPDLRGHGRSVLNDEQSRLRVRDIVVDLANILDQLGIQQVHVVGCSLGSICGLSLAATHPSRVATLALESIPDVHDAGARQYANDFIQYVFPRQERMMDRLHGEGEPGYARRLLLRNFALDLDEHPVDHVDAITSVSNVVQPTLVISGERDRVFPPHRALETVKKLQDSSLAVLPETGHLPHQEMPGVINEFVIDHVFRNASNSRAD